MDKPPLARSPLGGVPVTTIGLDEIVLRERPLLGKITLRGDGADRSFIAAATRALGCPLPERPGAGISRGATVLCLAPDEWLVVSEASAPDLVAALRNALADQLAAVIDVSSATATVGASGSRVPQLLRKICSLDLARDTARSCWQTRLGPFAVLLHRHDAAGTFDFHVARSYARSFRVWLDDAAIECGTDRDGADRARAAAP